MPVSEQPLPPPLKLQQVERPYTGRPSSRRIGLVTDGSRLDEMPIERAMVLSAGVHAFGPVIGTVLVLLLVFILSLLLNFNFWDWLKPPEKKADMVFTLVQDRNQARPDEARLRGQFNQQAGGEQELERPIAPPDDPEPTSKPTPPQPEQQQVQPSPPQPKQVEQPKPTPKPPKKAPQKQAKKQIKAPKPLVKAPTIATPKAVSKPSKVPPVSASAQNTSRNTNARPSQMPTGKLASASPTTSSSGSKAGNPEKGNNSRAGVNIQQDVDFGPFMAYLERQIKRNWKPPRAGHSKRVTLQFLLARDGRLLKVETLRSSGDATSDRAAINAVKAAAPFKPFPAQVTEDQLPIEFTFDYNVFNQR